MRKLFPIIICIILCSCSKKQDVAEANPTPADTIPSNLLTGADTLGAGWTKHSFQFADVYFVDNYLGYAVGNKVAKTMDGGTTWSTINTTNLFFNVNCSPDGKAFFTGATPIILSTTNAGSTFDTVNFNGILTDIYFPDNNNGYAVGQPGLFNTVNGGITWNHVLPVSGIQFGTSYSSLFFINNLSGWIITNDSLYRMNGSISSWSAAIFDIAPSAMFTGLYASSPSIVYAITQSGQVYKSTNAGANFSLLTSFPSTQNFADIHFVNDNTGYVSYARKIYKTSDGGATWQAVVSIVNQNFIELHFTNANHGWACADSALYIFRN